MRRALHVGLLLATLGAGGCFTGFNYVEPAGPRYAGPPVPAPASRRGHDTLRVVTFNIREADEIDEALGVLMDHVETRAADVILLQEMDAPGTERIARALGMTWVYYPAIRRSGNDRDFGNAVLSRWPIVDDRKVLLPHPSIFGRTRRIATAVTLRVGEVPVRVYSLHLATPVNLDDARRRDQLRVALADAEEHPRAIMGGDFNDDDLMTMAVRRGFTWPTRKGPRTVMFGRWDHILIKGLTVTATGTVLDNRGSSDHLPVWVEVIVR